MSEPISISFKDGAELSAILSKPKEGGLIDLERKLIIMVHGFPGHKSTQNNLYGDLEFILNDKGFHTLRFDFFGCGQSSGEEHEFTLKSARESLSAVKEWATNNAYQEFIFISEGMGTICALLEMELNLTCQIMLWPALDPPALAKTLYGSDNIPKEALEDGRIPVGDYKIGLPFVKELVQTNLRGAFQNVTMPVLILHGSSDELHPIGQLDLARKYMTSKRIEITTFHDGLHGLPSPNHRKSMAFHITQFLEKFA